MKSMFINISIHRYTHTSDILGVQITSPKSDLISGRTKKTGKRIVKWQRFKQSSDVVS